MNFTVLVTVAAVIWTLVTAWLFPSPTSLQSGGLAYAILPLVWLTSASALALYWAVRIVNFALRGPRR